jgi:transcriptional regulator with XRE-family HTH domain
VNALKFKDKLKQYRIENHLSQEELASKLFISRTLISKWENGVIYPSYSNMEKLAHIMNVSIDYLLSNEEAKLMTLNANSRKESTFTQKILFIISIILLTTGITLLITGFVFPQDLIRPGDIYNSVNTITVICFLLKIIGGLFGFLGASLLGINSFLYFKK